MPAATLARLGLGLLRHLEPETAHLTGLRLLRYALVPGTGLPLNVDPVEIAGLRFANRLGVAAGFDKNGEIFDRLLAWGFGSVEVGTVTPRPQAGNPRPRIFRLEADGAVINRLGFNNKGEGALARRLEKRPDFGVVGVNIGCNKDTEDPASDYVQGVRTFAGLADYLTVNVSSPNTPGLRNLQHAEALKALLHQVLNAREQVTGGAKRSLPVFVKLAPDLTAAELDSTLDALIEAGVDGIVLTNTTVARPKGLVSPRQGEMGGLSGRPLFDASTTMLRHAQARVGAKTALIGVGGVDGPKAFAAKRAAGAQLVQLYSAMVYRGIGLSREILLADGQAAAS